MPKPSAPNPSPGFLVILFLWLFFWEIGGQNVPNDWADVDEDRDLEAETIPIRFGTERSAAIIAGSLALSVGLSVILYWVTPARFGSLYLWGALASGVFLLLIPAYQLYKTGDRRRASVLFNRASMYPLAMLIVALFSSRA